MRGVDGFHITQSNVVPEGVTLGYCNEVTVKDSEFDCLTALAATDSEPETDDQVIRLLCVESKRNFSITVLLKWDALATHDFVIEKSGYL